MADSGSGSGSGCNEGLQPTDWNDPIAFQLEDLLSHQLHSIFRSAVKKIAECGYRVDIVEKAILRGGLYSGVKDPVSRIVDNTLVFLKKEKEMDVSRDWVCEDLQRVVEFTMLEMICVLREVKPSLSAGEAMWFLLICDMNLLHACMIKGNPSSGFGGKKGFGIGRDCVQTPNYYAGIPYDKSLGKYVPQDEKHEMILKLVPRLQELQNELQGCIEWANQKVMQAACKLSKDQAELKTMRREKEETEKLKKEKQILEENTMNRLSEMDLALGNANGQVGRANSTVRKLEVEISVLKKEMEAAKLRAAESAVSCREALEREQEALKKVHSREGQKGLFQEELTTEKRKVAELQQEVGKTIDRHNQIEARWKHEEMAKEKLLMQALSIRKEREQLEALAKEEEETSRQKADNDIQKYMEDIRKLENKLSQLRFKSESSKIAALRRGINRSGACSLTDSSSSSVLKGNQTPNVHKRLPYSQDSGTGGVRQDRECVMCLSEEMSVLFLPCAHQVVCAKCNELHEKQGMKDCPSCRTPIERRISVCRTPPSIASIHLFVGMGSV